MSASLPATNDKFDRILNLIWETQGAKGVLECQLAGVPLYRKEQMFQAYKRAKAASSAAIAELPFEELCEFHEYRKGVLAYYAQLQD